MLPSIHKISVCLFAESWGSADGGRIYLTDDRIINFDYLEPLSEHVLVLGIGRGQAQSYRTSCLRSTYKNPNFYEYEFVKSALWNRLTAKGYNRDQIYEFISKAENDYNKLWTPLRLAYQRLRPKHELEISRVVDQIEKEELEDQLKGHQHDGPGLYDVDVWDTTNPYHHPLFMQTRDKQRQEREELAKQLAKEMGLYFTEDQVEEIKHRMQYVNINSRRGYNIYPKFKHILTVNVNNVERIEEAT